MENGKFLSRLFDAVCVPLVWCGIGYLCLDYFGSFTDICIVWIIANLILVVLGSMWDLISNDKD